MFSGGFEQHLKEISKLKRKKKRRKANKLARKKRKINIKVFGK